MEDVRHDNQNISPVIVNSPPYLRSPILNTLPIYENHTPSLLPSLMTSPVKISMDNQPQYIYQAQPDVQTINMSAIQAPIIPYQESQEELHMRYSALPPSPFISTSAPSNFSYAAPPELIASALNQLSTFYFLFDTSFLSLIFLFLFRFE